MAQVAEKQDDEPSLTYRVERLEAGFDDMRAVLGRLEPMIVSIHAQIPYLATKAEVANLKSELKADMADLKSELKADITEVRSELKADVGEAKAELKADLAEVRTELKAEVAELRGIVLRLPTWPQLFALMLGLCGAIFAIIRFTAP